MVKIKLTKQEIEPLLDLNVRKDAIKSIMEDAMTAAQDAHVEIMREERKLWGELATNHCIKTIDKKFVGIMTMTDGHTYIVDRREVDSQQLVSDLVTYSS